MASYNYYNAFIDSREKWKNSFLSKKARLKCKAISYYKLNTMRDIFDNGNFLVADVARLTLVRCFVRSLLLDELMKLFNIIKGDMRSVGPRPILMKFLDC